MSPIDAFLIDLDRAWDGPPGPKICLRIIGSTALMMQTSYARGTKDRDVLEADVLRGEVGTRLKALAGPDSRLHVKHRVYLDIVGRGIPFLPRVPEFLPVPGLDAQLAHFHIETLSVLDTVVSKLKRFNANDIDDIEAMVRLDLVDPERLIERFRSAVDGFLGDARADDLPRYIRHLHRVERDFLMKVETPIELPSWIDDSD